MKGTLTKVLRLEDKSQLKINVFLEVFRDTVRWNFQVFTKGYRKRTWKNVVPFNDYSLRSLNLEERLKEETRRKVEACGGWARIYQVKLELYRSIEPKFGGEE